MSDGTRESRKPWATPSVEGVQDLARLCQQAGVELLEASDGNWSVRLRLDLTVAAVSPEVIGLETDEAHGPHVLVSQWVGIFHGGPEGESEPYAREGREVKEGDVLGVIEAMQLQHEVQADHAGTLMRLLVEDGTPVEYGQPLAEIG